MYVAQLGVVEEWERDGGTESMNFTAEVVNEDGTSFVVVHGLQGVQLPLSQDPTTVARAALALVLGGSPDAYDVHVTGAATPARPRARRSAS